MYAVVEFKGKQYRADVGAILKVDRFDAEKGATVSLDKVLLVSGDSVKVGCSLCRRRSRKDDGPGRDQGRQGSSLQVQAQKGLSPHPGPPAALYAAQGGGYPRLRVGSKPRKPA